MKKFMAIVLAVLMSCALFAANICAAGNGGALLSDEYGDYYSYENGAVKAYVRVNQGAVTAAVENGMLAVYDADGNRLELSGEFSFEAHPWIKEITEEYVRQNTVYGENGEVEAEPEVGIPAYYVPNSDIDEQVEIKSDDWAYWGDDDTDDTDDGAYSEGGAPAPGASVNPSTGIALAAAPAVLAAACAAVIRKK